MAKILDKEEHGWDGQVQQHLTTATEHPATTDITITEHPATTAIIHTAVITIFMIHLADLITSIKGMLLKTMARTAKT